VLRGPVSAVARTRHGKKFLNDPPELFVYENALVRTPFNSSEDRVVIEELDPNRLRHELIGMIDFVKGEEDDEIRRDHLWICSRTCWRRPIPSSRSFGASSITRSLRQTDHCK